MGRVIVVTSGKGGTGKTSLTSGVSVGLAELGARVLCIDGDIGLRNLDISLGMTDTVLMDFTDVMEGRCTLDRAVAPHPVTGNLFLLTAPLSHTKEPIEKELFKALLQKARVEYDFILIDCAAGLGSSFELATYDADEAIVVSMSDLSALRDAQRVVSALTASITKLWLVVNRVQPKMLRRLGTNIDDLMDNVGLPLLGIVPEDSRVLLAANSGQALLQSGKSTAAQAYRNIAKRIDGYRVPLMKIR